MALCDMSAKADRSAKILIRISHRLTTVHAAAVDVQHHRIRDVVFGIDRWAKTATGETKLVARIQYLRQCGKYAVRQHGAVVHEVLYNSTGLLSSSPGTMHTRWFVFKLCMITTSTTDSSLVQNVVYKRRPCTGSVLRTWCRPDDACHVALTWPHAVIDVSKHCLGLTPPALARFLFRYRSRPFRRFSTTFLRLCVS